MNSKNTHQLLQCKRTALWLLSMVALLGGTAMAQDTTTTSTNGATSTDANSKNAKQLQQVVVTGTRSQNRTEAESLSPIDVLSPKDLTSTGSTDLASALGKLLPSLDFPRPAINDGNDAIRPASLRGLSPDDTLVLVDGKRYHTSALVNYNSSVGRGSAPADLNSIPISAIDHIEVLRDGAAAQYGSDAIAGVINIVLKHGTGSGNSITAGGGIMDKGDGAQNSVDGSVGVDLGGKGADAKGWWRVAWNYSDTMDTNRAENTHRSTTLAGAPAVSPGYERYGDPAVQTYQVLTNFAYDLTPNIELYGYLNLSRRDVTSNGYYRYYNNARNVTAIYPNGFLPQIVNHTNDTEAVLGIKGKTDGGWNWDVAGNYGNNDLTYDIQHTLNVALYEREGIPQTYFRASELKNSQGLFTVDLSKEFTPGFLRNPLTVAYGAGYREEKYKLDAGEPNSYYIDPEGVYAGGSQVYAGLSPDAAGNFNRHSQFAYVDLENDLTDKLSAGVAGRYEHYSDSGSTRSGKLSARYQFTDSFALRGTASNGFRAPSLAQQDYESIATLIQNGTLVSTGTYRVSSPAAQALGAKALRPEKSTNYSLGAVWQPLNEFSATLDVYQIRIWNQILYSDQIDLDPADNPGLAAYFNAAVPGQQVSAAQYFANAATTRTRGADLVTNYRWDLQDLGAVTFTGSANWNQIKVLEVAGTPSQLTDNSSVPITLFGRASQGLLTKSTPRTKIVFGADWAIDSWDFRGNLTRYGTVTRLGDTADEDQTFSARWLLDLSVAYTLQQWTFALGGDNITNQYPTKASTVNPYEDRADGLQYSSLSPFGFNGRYWYAKVTYRF